MLDLPAKNVKTTVIMGASIITMETYVVGVIVEVMVVYALKILCARHLANDDFYN